MSPNVTPEPQIGMIVTTVRDGYCGLVAGSEGVIDLVDRETKQFWVLAGGGFIGWTSFESWAWSGNMLPRTEETEGWYQMREELERR